MFKFKKRKKEEKQEKNPIDIIYDLVDEKTKIEDKIYESTSTEEYNLMDKRRQEIDKKIFDIFDTNRLWDEDFPEKEYDKCEENGESIKASIWLDIESMLANHRMNTLTEQSLKQMDALNNIMNEHDQKMKNLADTLEREDEKRIAEANRFWEELMNKDDSGPRL